MLLKFFILYRGRNQLVKSEGHWMLFYFLCGVWQGAEWFTTCLFSFYFNGKEISPVIKSSWLPNYKKKSKIDQPFLNCDPWSQRGHLQGDVLQKSQVLFYLFLSFLLVKHLRKIFQVKPKENMRRRLKNTFSLVYTL